MPYKNCELIVNGEDFTKEEKFFGSIYKKMLVSQKRTNYNNYRSFNKKEKNMKKLLTLLLACLMMVTLFGCGSNTDDEDVDPKEGKTTVVYIINGTLGDKSFFDSGKEGLDMITEDFGDQVYCEYRELTYDNSTWETKMADIVAEGWDIVISGTWDMLGYTEKLASEYPDTKFWFFDEQWDFEANPCENVYCMLFKQNEGSFVVGAMAAMASTTGKVAFMGGMNNTVLDDFFVGFANGAKYVNPEIQVNCSWMNSFNDVTAGKDTATGLYESGYDVVFACGGQAGLGGFDAVIAQPEGNWIIGVDGNQGAMFAAQGSDEGTAKANRTITSMQKNVNVGFYNAMKQHLEGTLPYGTNVKLGLDGEFVSASVTDTTNTVFTEEQMNTINSIIADIVAGNVEVGTAFDQAEGWFDQFVESVK